LCHAGRHAHDGARLRANRGLADRQGEGAFEDQHERIERRRMFGESLPRVEGEERQSAPRGFRKHSARVPCAVSVMSEWSCSAFAGGIVAVLEDMGISCSSQVERHATAYDARRQSIP
jgi:hypothetical protein